MTPLDAARRLAEESLTHSQVCPDMERCIVCGGATEGSPFRGGTWVDHKPDCPVPALPAIVRALEAATRFIGDAYWIPHRPDCTWLLYCGDGCSCGRQELVSALVGEAPS